MAKIRVYELAKELLMENKALMDLIHELGIEIKSHSSSLSDDQISLIKGHLKGTKSLVVEEQRIKSTVIRRRRKIVEVEPVIEPPAEEPIPEPQPEPKRPKGKVVQEEPPIGPITERVVKKQPKPAKETPAKVIRPAEPVVKLVQPHRPPSPGIKPEEKGTTSQVKRFQKTKYPPKRGKKSEKLQPRKKPPKPKSLKRREKFLNGRTCMTNREKRPGPTGPAEGESYPLKNLRKRKLPSPKRSNAV